MSQTDRVELFGMPLDLLTMDQTVRRCVAFVESGSAVQHVVTNAGKIVLAHADGRLREIISACGLVNADGQSVVWVGRMAGHPVPERVAGIDLMARLLREAQDRGWSAYFLGAKPTVLQTFVGVVAERFPSLRIAGSCDGYFDGDGAAADAIKASGAKLVFVGMPSPRKEYFTSEMLPRMGGVLVVGVGGSFDVWAGITRRAPAWMQRSGLEWFYRLTQEPRRMWKRYLVGNARFVVIAIDEVLRQRLRLRRRSRS